VFGVAGLVRAVEVTVGNSGWHPHAHVLLFTEAGIDPERLMSAAWCRWRESLRLQGVEHPSRDAFDLQLCADGSAGLVAGYVAKGSDTWGVGAELMRGDVKRGRSGARSPFELLDDSDRHSLLLWHEFVVATRGRRSMGASRGLLDDPPTDDVVDADGVECLEAMVDPVVVFQVRVDVFRRLGWLGRVGLLRRFESSA